MGNFKDDIAAVKAFVFDVDGVFTDGRIMVTADNQFVRTYDSKDGFAMKALVKKGYKVAVISGGRGDSLAFRFNMLGVSDLYLDNFQKLDALKDFMAKYGLEPDEVIFMGDDIPDMEPMLYVGIPVCPADAAHDVKRISRYVSGYKGGEGCVRDIVEQVMRAQGKWDVPEFGTSITSAL